MVIGEELQRRMHPPENEVPVVLPVNRVLGRTDAAAVVLTEVLVHSTGLSFTVVVRVRPSAGLLGERDLSDLVFEHGRSSAGFLVGVELADGRRLGGRGRRPRGTEEDGLLLSPGGGSAGWTSAEQQWWLSPLPPEGPLRVVVRCDPLGIAETITELDGTAIRRAADDVVELWPWEPERSGPDDDPPAPPDLPADSWFAERPREGTAPGGG